MVRFADLASPNLPIRVEARGLFSSIELTDFKLVAYEMLPQRWDFEEQLMDSTCT